MRDFPSTMPKLQVKFKYRPEYLKSSKAKKDEAAFEKFASQVGLPPLQHCNLVLEGGNIVENGENCAISSERVFKDNKGKSEDNVVKTLEAAIKRKVVFIPDPEDTTGHSDGVVSFVEKDVLFVGSYPDPDGQEYFKEIDKEVKKEFPSMNIVPLPCYEVKKKSYGFVSAEGSYANSLVTNNAVYLPYFTNQTSNKRAFDVFTSYTDKHVVPVHSAGKLALLGGSLRCMTWQIDQDHLVAQALFRYIEGSGGDDDESDDDEDG
jgi:agmatine/peptidylarginine deiminase